jgi:hypothetical protein
MPIPTQTGPRGKRSATVWGILPAVVVSLLLGVFAWSCVEPVVLGTPTYWLTFGGSPRLLRGFPPPYPPLGFGYWHCKLPGGSGTGWYQVTWVLPLTPPARPGAQAPAPMRWHRLPNPGRRGGVVAVLGP